MQTTAERGTPKEDATPAPLLASKAATGPILRQMLEDQRGELDAINTTLAGVQRELARLNQLLGGRRSATG